MAVMKWRPWISGSLKLCAGLLAVLVVSGSLWGVLGAMGDRAGAAGAMGVTLVAAVCWGLNFIALVTMLALAYLESTGTSAEQNDQPPTEH